VPTWTQSLAIGVAAIDDQHQELFSRADALLAAMKRGRPEEEVRRLIHFLEDYCSRHFRSEEELMRAQRHPGLMRHKEQHALFTLRFHEVLRHFLASGPSPSVTIDLQDLLCRWFVQHVRTMDVMLASRPSARFSPERTARACSIAG
jgi:hemerythrin